MFELLSLAMASSMVSIREPDYATRRPPVQDVEIRPRINQIVHPTVGMPALVRAGDVLDVLVARCEPPRLLRGELVPVGDDLVVPLHHVGTSLRSEGLWEVQLEVPGDVGAETYDLRLEGGCLEDRQPSSVRVTRGDGPFRFVVLSDQQFGDPTALLPLGDRNSGLHPLWSTHPEDRARAQVRHELELLDPLFVLYPGDLVFGVDYPSELADAHDYLADSRFASFVVPGNHDAYAHRAATGLEKAVHCAELPRWEEVGRCLLEGRESGLTVEYDGLEGFRRILGPDDYSFRVGGLRFIGVNTYGGTRSRRSAYPVSPRRLAAVFGVELPSLLGLDELGVSLVDNYGGFVEEPTQTWLAEQLAAAERSREPAVVFGHHDPSAIFLDELASAPNDVFPTEPWKLEPFEVWNYDAGWDSNPGDGIGQEEQGDHTGTRMLDALARSGAVYLCGHAHRDAVRAHPPSREPELHVPGRATIIQTTTASAGVARDGYRGYRVLEVRDRGIHEVDFLPEEGLGSLPAGNFWRQDDNLVSTLPRAITTRVRLELLEHDSGFDFHGGRLVDFTHRDGRFVAWLEVELPASGGVPTVTAFGAVPATDRSPPVARAVPLEKTTVGERVLLSSLAAEDSLRQVWRVDGRVLEGAQVPVVFDEEGLHTVELTVYDAQGGFHTSAWSIEVSEPLRLGWLLALLAVGGAVAAGVAWKRGVGRGPRKSSRGSRSRSARGGRSRPTPRRRSRRARR